MPRSLHNRLEWIEDVLLHGKPLDSLGRKKRKECGAFTVNEAHIKIIYDVTKRTNQGTMGTNECRKTWFVFLPTPLIISRPLTFIWGAFEGGLTPRSCTTGVKY